MLEKHTCILRSDKLPLFRKSPWNLQICFDNVPVELLNIFVSFKTFLCFIYRIKYIMDLKIFHSS